MSGHVFVESTPLALMLRFIALSKALAGVALAAYVLIG